MKYLFITIITVQTLTFASELTAMQDACEHNISDICYNLGAIFSGEDGLKPQLKKSQYYLQKACTLNHLKACTLLDEVENRLSGKQDNND